MSNAENNKRIAKNTAFLYLRMLISMSVSLYTSRVILRALGFEDYGIYNIVGGVVAMFSFINATMSSATSRFITFELGRGNTQKLKDTFNASFWSHIIIAAIILILSESIGLWFLHYKMVIPAGRELAATIVFHLSVISTIVTIIQVPYNATLIAHEKMDIYAYVEMVNVFLKLGILFILESMNVDKLILYGFLIFIVSSGISIFYYAYCIKHFDECKVRRELQLNVIKPMLSFSGWDLFGNLSVTARTQGVSLLLNIFFGPIMNAAAGIASSVQAAVMSFAGNVNTAVRPQIIKYYAQGEYKKMESLINNACKLNFLILSILIIPICSEIDFILNLWLEEVPLMTSTFCILTLTFNILANMSFIVNTGNHATGKILRPSLINGLLYILVIPITYIFFKIGGNPWVPFVVNICAVFVGILSNVYTLHLNVPAYSVMTFIKNVLLRCMVILLVGIAVTLVINYYYKPSFLRLVITGISTTIFISIVGWYIMIPVGIKNVIVSKIKSFVCKKN